MSDTEVATNPDSAAQSSLAANTATGSSTSSITKDELLELVRAIKFAKPEASIRVVHREITETLSRNEGFEFLQHVRLNDVKKVWKKAQQPPKGATDTSTAATRDADSQAVLDALPGEKNSIVKLYTVGDGTVKTLAQEYRQAAAAAAAEQEKEEKLNNYVHFFVDVPADRSGTRPHQALINFQSDKQEQHNKSSKKQLSSAGEEIVKIQMAATSKDDTTKHPMLLYNANRTIKTFIHNDDDDEGTENGYDKIQNWIVKEGVGGALGTKGGTKAYFYSRITKRRNGSDVVSIDVVSGLAPPQEW